MQNKKHRQRKIYDKEILDVISWLRFPLIMGVVLAHCNLYALVENWEGAAPQWSGWLVYIFKYLYWIILPARVPLLFIISGYLFFRTEGRRDKSFFIDKYKRRIHSLLIPYIFWNTIAIAIQYIRFDIIGGENYSLAEYMCGYWSSIFNGNPADSPLWFMRDLMVVSLFSPLLYILIKGRYGFVVIAAFAVAYILNLRIPIEGFGTEAFLFFTTGAYIAVHRYDITSIPHNIGIVTLLLYIPLQLYSNEYESYSIYAQSVNLVTTAIKITAAFYAVSLLFKKNVLSPTPRLTKICFLLYALHGIIIGPIIKTLYYNIPCNNNTFVLLAIYIVTPLIILAFTLFLFDKMKRYTPLLATILTGNRK